jgi:hypothetical protein
MLEPGLQAAYRDAWADDRGGDMFAVIDKICRG